MNCFEFLIYLLTCGCCRRPEYKKKVSPHSKKEFGTLEEITPHKKSPFAESTDPTTVKTSQMTQIFHVGDGQKYRTDEEVLRAQGFRIESHIAKGAFGSVDKAVHIEKNFVVAIKRIRIPSRIHDRKSVMYDIKNELFILETVKHQHIILLITHFIMKSKNSEQLFIVMQFAPGGTLSAFLDECGPFDEQSCCVWFAQMLDALSFMHEVHRVAHRDLKLTNILLDQNKDVLISDFGLSRISRTADNELKASKTYCGTPPYMAPELLTIELNKTDNEYDAQKVDVWALGVILFKLFNKRYPFDVDRQRRCLRNMKKKKWDFFIHKMNEPTHQFRNILKNIFEPNPEKRISMAQLKEHVWVRHMFDKELDNTKTLRELDEEHRKSVRANKTPPINVGQKDRADH